MEKAQKELETVKIEDEVTDVICENCGRNMVIKYGPHGKIPGLPGISGVQEYEAVLGKDRSALSEVWRKRLCVRKTKKGQQLSTAAKKIRNVILCHGKNLRPTNDQK